MDFPRSRRTGRSWRCSSACCGRAITSPFAVRVLVAATCQQVLPMLMMAP